MASGRYLKHISFGLLVIDLGILNISYFLSCLFFNINWNEIFVEKELFLGIYANLVWIIISRYTTIYGISRYSSFELLFKKIVKTLILHFIFVFLFLFLFKYYNISKYSVITTYLIFFVVLSIGRQIIIKLVKYFRSKGYNRRKIIIVGAGPLGFEVFRYVTSDISIGLKFFGFFDDYPEKCLNPALVLGKVEDAKVFAISEKIDEIIIALPEFAETKIKDLIKFSEKNLIRVKIVPDFYRYFAHKINIDFFGPIPFLLIRQEPLQSLANRLIKRIFDIIFSLLILICIFPWFLPVIGTLIKLTSKGPVFFRQKRSGLNNKVFLMWKFRTMVINGMADIKQASINDERITRIGHILRSTNLDELPQFINVLFGSMSVIGPRPHMLKHTEEYSMIIDNFMVRHFVKPGITGWAQVTGYRGETSDPTRMKNRVEKDVWYIENWTFYLDLKIFYYTIKNMILGDKNAV